MKRHQPVTDPPTYTAGEVARIFKGKITEVGLERWDKSGIFRPSYYWKDEKLIVPSERDAQIELNPSHRGNPKRRYTYQDLVWLRLFIYVKDHYASLDAGGAVRRSVKIIQAIRKLTDDRCPAASRLFFVGSRDVYLLDDHGVAEHLSEGRQLAMRILLTDTIVADVRGRIAVLEASTDIRSLHATGNGWT